MAGSVYPRGGGKSRPKVRGGSEESGTDVWVSQKIWEGQLPISWSVLPMQWSQPYKLEPAVAHMKPGPVGRQQCWETSLLTCLDLIVLIPSCIPGSLDSSEH